MATPTSSHELISPASLTAAATDGDLEIAPCVAGQEDEALKFLATRPIHTVVMRGFIRDNGLVSAANRGTFYACRDRQQEGALVGLALVGHLTMIEAHAEPALTALARYAQHCPNARVLMGEQEKIAKFFSHYAEAGQAPRLICRELLFEQCGPIALSDPVLGLREATFADLPLIIPVHAQLAFEDSGVNPLETDPVGFRRRCARRIEQGRVWVWVEQERLMFKADVVSDTPEVIYLEGVYVRPENRGQGYALRCLSQLGLNLLTRTRSICLLVNEHNHAAQSLYRKARYELRSCYDTIFLQS
ncbi:MAG: GNAT family N-acetyltransferase [Pyrinomonadaceae bacterium]